MIVTDREARTGMTCVDSERSCRGARCMAWTYVPTEHVGLDFQKMPDSCEGTDGDRFGYCMKMSDFISKLAINTRRSPK